MRLSWLLLPLVACGAPASPALPPVAPNALRAPEDFASIKEPRERSKALFKEAARVMLHPRCSNCHPAGDSPLQGDDARVHDPPVVRGPNNEGVPALECTSCHQDKNVELARVPGAPSWHLAPIEMAWVGRTPTQLCEQLKDRKRNGNKSIDQIVEHTAHDSLVAWGWEPGHGRAPAPGSQKGFGALMAAWARDGGECP